MTQCVFYSFRGLKITGMNPAGTAQRLQKAALYEHMKAFIYSTKKRRHPLENMTIHVDAQGSWSYFQMRLTFRFSGTSKKVDIYLARAGTRNSSTFKVFTITKFS